MKEEWQSKTLEEVCQFSNGLWKGEKPPFVNVGIIRNTNFTKDGTLDYSDIAYLDVEMKKLEKRRLRYGDIILEKSGGGPKQPVGRVALFDKEDGDFSFSNFTAALRVLDPNILDFRFLHKFLYWAYISGVTEGMQSHSTGIRNLNGDAYKAIKISFPPLREQRRIVAKLDEAFAAIETVKANAEKSLQSTRDVFESELNAIFKKKGDGWIEGTIGEILKLEYGKPLDAKDRSADGKFPAYGANGEKTRTDKFYHDKPSIIVGRKGSAGELNLTEDRFWPLDVTYFVTYDDRRHNIKFLYYLLTTLELRKLAKGVKPGINRNDVYSIVRSVPPLREQEAVVARLDNLQEETKRLASIYQQKLTTLDTLKKSLLHHAFTGNL